MAGNMAVGYTDLDIFSVIFRTKKKKLSTKGHKSGDCRYE